MSYVAQQEHEAPRHLGRTAPPDSKQIRQKGDRIPKLLRLNSSQWPHPCQRLARPNSFAEEALQRHKKKLHQHKPQTIHRRRENADIRNVFGEKARTRLGQQGHVQPGKAAPVNQRCKTVTWGTRSICVVRRRTKSKLHARLSPPRPSL